MCQQWPSCESPDCYAASLWVGLLAPAGLPPEVNARLQKETQAVLARAEVRDKLVKAGYEINAGTGAEFAAFVRSESDKLGKVIRDAKIEVE